LVANKVSSGFGVCLTLLKQGMLKRSGKNILYITLFVAFRFRNMHIDISCFCCIFIERLVNFFLKPFTGELSEDYFLKYYYPENYGDEQDEEVQRTGSKIAI
jgi:hypothetical protein